MYDAAHPLKIFLSFVVTGFPKGGAKPDVTYVGLTHDPERVDGLFAEPFGALRAKIL